LKTLIFFSDGDLTILPPDRLVSDSLWQKNFATAISFSSFIYKGFWMEAGI